MPASTQRPGVMTQPPLIRALLDPAASPLPGRPLSLMETHASWVVLAGERAYKLKKPITLPFLDYGTLEKRRAACEAELRYNRRFAPELYLGIVVLTGTAAAPQCGGSGEIIDYAVEMLRFDEASRLDHLAARGALTPAHMSLLAAEMVDFHRRAAIAPADSSYGTPELAAAPALENFVELYRLLPDEAPRLAELEAWTKREAKHRRTQFTARKQKGCVRECHGDLHLGNLILHQDRVVAFDCIEFNENFRWIDVASELAFTLVDLLDHDKPCLAAVLLNEWLSAGGDFDALRVLRFYAAYRALVRAKVSAIRAGQEDGAAAAREDRDTACAYLDLAQRLCQPQAPTLTITHGVSGAGKSHAAQALLLADPHANTVRLRSDVERKRLFGLAAQDRSGSPLDGGIYTQDAHAATYRRLEELAQLALHEGWSVIVDAAFLRRAERDAFRRLAANNDVPFAILACEAPVAELRRRIEARHDDASEATLAVLERQLGWIETLADDEREFVVA
jgi:aminoglycoside phosphotransferase family enzyme/predicted kinase